MKPVSRFILTVMIVSLLLFSVIPREASAFPYRIEGYVKNSDGTPIVLATITLTGMIYNYSAQDYTEEVIKTQTDAYGYYNFAFGAGEPGGLDMGSTVTISYDSGSKVIANMVVIEGSKSWANLTYQESHDFTDLITSPLGMFSLIFIASISIIAYYLYVSHTNKNDIDKPPKRVERRRRQR